MRRRPGSFPHGHRPFPVAAFFPIIVAFFVLSLPAVVVAIPAPVDLRIGVLIPVTGGWSVGYTAHAAVPIALEQLGEFVPDHASLFRLHPVYYNSHCAEKIAVAAVLDVSGKAMRDQLLPPGDGGPLSPRGPFAGVIGDACSSSSRAVQLLMSAWLLPQVSWAAESEALSNKALYNTFARTIGHSGGSFGAYDYLFKRMRWESAALIGTTDTSKVFLKNLLYSRWSNTTGEEWPVKVHGDYTYPPTSGDVADPNADDRSVKAFMSKMKEEGVRVFSIHGYGKQLREIALASEELGMVSGYAYITLNLPPDAHQLEGVNATENAAVAEENEKALRAMSGWISIEQYVDGAERRDTLLSDIARRHREFFPAAQHPGIGDLDRAVTEYAANLYDAVVLYARAVGGAIRAGRDPLNGTDIFNRMVTDRFEGASGSVRLSASGDRESSWSIFEKRGSELIRRVTWFPDDRDPKETDDIDEWMLPGNRSSIEAYVKPTNEITLEISAAARMLITSSAGLTAVLTLPLFAFVWLKRDTRPIRMSSPTFSLVILVGCLILPIGVITYVNFNSNVAACMSTPIIMSLSFTLIFGALFARSYRVHTIFNKLKVTEVATGRDLFSIIAGLLAIDVVLFVLWWAIAPMRPTAVRDEVTTTSYTDREGVDADRSTFATVLRCEDSGPFIYIIMGIKSAVLLWGIYLAFLIRKVNVKVMNDAKPISLAIYNVAMLLVIGVPFLFASHRQHDRATTTASIFTVIVIAAGLVTLAVLFVPKIIAVLRAGSGDDTLPEITMSRRGNNSSVVFTTTSAEGTVPSSGPAGGAAAATKGSRSASSFEQRQAPASSASPSSPRAMRVGSADCISSARTRSVPSRNPVQQQQQQQRQGDSGDKGDTPVGGAAVKASEGAKPVADPIAHIRSRINAEEPPPPPAPAAATVASAPPLRQPSTTATSSPGASAAALPKVANSPGDDHNDDDDEDGEDPVGPVPPLARVSDVDLDLE